MLEVLQEAFRVADRGVKVDIVFTDDDRISNVTITGFDQLGIAIEHQDPRVFARLVPWTAIAVLEVQQP